MLDRILKTVLVAAAGLGLVACTSYSGLNGLEADTTIHHAGFNGASVSSGSVLKGAGRYNVAASVTCSEAHATGASVSVRSRPELCPDHDSLPLWTEALSAQLGACAHKAFGPNGPPVSVVIFVRGAKDGGNLRQRTKVKPGEALPLAFVAPAAQFGANSLRVPASVVAHEAYHALSSYEQSRSAGAIVSRTHESANSQILEEAAANVFSLCVTVRSSGLESRAESVHTIYDRYGGVVTDAELKALLAWDEPFRLSLNSAMETSLLGEVVFNTLWTSLIGPDYLVVDKTPEGERLLSLCTTEILGSTKEGLVRLLHRFAEDGVDAPPLPAWSEVIGENYFARYRDAIIRWRTEAGQ